MDDYLPNKEMRKPSRAVEGTILRSTVDRTYTAEDNALIPGSLGRDSSIVPLTRDSTAHHRWRERSERPALANPSEVYGYPERYVILSEHDRGGLGRILRAYDQHLDRIVAIKELLDPGERGEHRFLREATLTARLEHGGIVPIHEIGRTRDGIPYYVMKFISGRSLKELLQSSTDLSSRMALLPIIAAAADAIAYAHSEGIIHRDIKPGNIVVGDYGETFVVDWGLAKELGHTAETGDYRRHKSPISRSEELTGKGAVIGTPAYMAPEQAIGVETDERTDVFGLGCTLAHILIGEDYLKWREKTSAAKTSFLHGKKIPPALDSIISKATNEDRVSRYDSAKDLAEDVRAILSGRLVTVHSYSRNEVIVSWMMRNRLTTLVGLLGLSLIALASSAGLFAALDQRDLARAERSAAVASSQELEAQRDELVLVHAEKSLERDPTKALQWLEDEARLSSRERALNTTAAANARGVAYTILEGHDALILSMSFSARGLATASVDRTLRLWDIHSGEFDTVTDQLGPFAQAAFAEEQLVYATRSAVRIYSKPGDRDEVLSTIYSPVRVLRTAGRYAVAQLEGGGVMRYDTVALRAEVISSISARDLTVDEDGTVYLCSELGLYAHPLPPRISLRLGDCDNLGGMGLVATGTGVIAASGSTVKMYESSGSLKEDWNDSSNQVTAVAAAPDGRLVAYGDELGKVVVRDSAEKRVKLRRSLETRIVDAAFSPDSRFVAFADERGLIWLADLRTHDYWYLRGHEGSMFAELSFSPDGRWLASADSRQQVRVWQIPHSRRLLIDTQQNIVYNTKFSDDSRSLLTDGYDRTVRLWSTAGLPLKALRIFDGHDALTYGAKFGLRRDEVFTASWDGTLRRWDSDRSSVGLHQHNGVIWDFLITTRGVVASVGSDGNLIISGHDSNVPISINAHHGDIFRVASAGHEQSPVLFTAGIDGYVKRWGPDGAPLGVCRVDGTSVLGLAVLSSRYSVFSTADGRVMLCDPERSVSYVIARHEARVRELVYVSGLISWVAEDGVLCVLSGRFSKRCVSVGQRKPTSLAADQRGEEVAVAFDTGEIFLYRPSLGARAILPAGSDEVRALEYSPDGQLLASAGVGGELSIWSRNMLGKFFVNGH